jgi:hypothetical protein
LSPATHTHKNHWFVSLPLLAMNRNQLRWNLVW